PRGGSIRAEELAGDTGGGPAGPMQYVLGEVFVRRRLPSRGDPPRPSGMRLYPRLARLLSSCLCGAARAGALALRNGRSDRCGPRHRSMMDVLVAGGGPAGAVAAYGLAKRGYRVTLVAAGRR